MATLPSWARQKLLALENYRKRAKRRGHDTSRVTLGHHDGLVLAADDGGAYHFRLGDRGDVTFRAIGHPSVVLESITHGRA